MKIHKTFSLFCKGCSAFSLLRFTFLLFNFSRTAYYNTSTTDFSYWVVKYILDQNTKDDRFDFETSLEFLENTTGSGVFSPTCCEKNIISQAAAGEYNHWYNDLVKTSPRTLNIDFKAHSLTYLKEIINNEYNCDKGNCSMSTSCRNQKEFSNYFPIESDGYGFRKYIYEESEAIFNANAEGVNQSTASLLETPQASVDFPTEERIYKSVLHFKNNWNFRYLKEFTNKIIESELASPAFKNRYFMRCSNSIKMGGTKNDPFQVVAVPFAGLTSKNHQKQYMVYIIPKETDADLPSIWKAFHDSFRDIIFDFIDRAKTNFIKLFIPKIDALTTELDIVDVLKKTYAGGPTTIVKSKMVTSITINEEGVETTSGTHIKCGSTPFSPGEAIKVDRPHIAFVFSMEKGRILLIIKDMGII